MDVGVDGVFKCVINDPSYYILAGGGFHGGGVATSEPTLHTGSTIFPYLLYIYFYISPNFGGTI